MLFEGVQAAHLHPILRISCPTQGRAPNQLPLLALGVKVLLGCLVSKQLLQRGACIVNTGSGKGTACCAWANASRTICWVQMSQLRQEDTRAGAAAEESLKSPTGVMICLAAGYKVQHALGRLKWSNICWRHMRPCPAVGVPMLSS